jgi:pimeloyl-ACP methyl ester carboxylesterase
VRPGTADPRAAQAGLVCYAAAPMRRLLPAVMALALAGAGCTYLRSAAKQAFRAEHPEDPSATGAAAASPGDPARGSIQGLDDARFDPETAELGLYDPPAFLERAPTLLYALGPEDPALTPVVFVHGITGSPRDFGALIAGLDRSRYQPWLFYYPSGAALGATAQDFHRLVLASGSRVPPGPILIVAHSMGGLVVREALNRCEDAAGQARVARLVTIAAPFGGFPGAAPNLGPVKVPSWRDLDPESPFLARLHRQPLPPDLEFHLLFTYENTRRVKLGENSDGVIPLASQLEPAAQAEATVEYGLNETHTSVLQDEGAVRRILAALEGVVPRGRPRGP